MEIGLIGLGAMGSGIAGNLLKAGHRLRVWNRSAGPLEDLVRKGAERAATPADVFDRTVVFTMLSDDAAIRSVIIDAGVLKEARRDTIHVVMSTISVAFAQSLETAHRQAGVAYVAAPVMGRPDIAAAGELNILVAGEEQAIARVRPALEAVGKAVWPVGTEPHKANLVKLTANLALGATIETLAEVMALARRYAIDPHRLLEIFTGTLFGAAAYKTYGPLIADQRFEPALFKLPLGLKDIRLALEAGEGAGAPLPVASLVRNSLIDAIGHGDADKDWSVLAAAAFRRAGL
jgi:3-hydroxyisobutyrate dehydrogenase-like beta-hydroxyacid dehydrogenase